MTIDLAPLKAKVIEEINLLPGEKLLDIYEFIHYFRVGLESSSPKVNNGTQQILALAGSWNDMPGETFTAFLEEIDQRRQQAFARRRNREASAD